MSRLPKITADPGGFVPERSYVARMVRSRALRVWAASVVALVLLLFLDTVNTLPRFFAYIRPAGTVTAEELAAITDPEDTLVNLGFSFTRESSSEWDDDPRLRRLFYLSGGSFRLSYSPSGIKKTDFAPINTKTDNTGGWVRYDFAEVGEYYMLVKLPANHPGLTLTGTVGYLPADIRDAALSYTDIGPERVLPVMFDATGEVFGGVKTEAFFSIAALAFWAVWEFFAVRRIFRPETAPAYRQLAIYPQSRDELLGEIDRELSGGGCYRQGRYILTPTWEIESRVFGFNIKRRDAAGGEDRR